MIFLAMLSEKEPDKNITPWLMKHDPDLVQAYLDFVGGIDNQNAASFKIELRTSSRFEGLRFRPYIFAVRVVCAGQEMSYSKMPVVAIMNPEHDTVRPTAETEAKYQFRKGELDSACDALIADAEWEQISIGITEGGNALYLVDGIDTEEFNALFVQSRRGGFALV